MLDYVIAILLGGGIQGIETTLSKPFWACTSQGRDCGVADFPQAIFVCFPFYFPPIGSYGREIPYASIRTGFIFFLGRILWIQGLPQSAPGTHITYK